MADTTKDIWNDDDGEEQPSKHHRLRNFFIFFLTLLVVLVCVLAAAWRDGTGLDALRRYVSYGKNEGDGNTGYVYDASSGNRFVQLGEALVILSETSLSLVNQDGQTIWSTPVKMQGPALNQSGDAAVAYDVGGTELYVVDEAGLRYELPAENEEPYISASLNDHGELAVTARKQNYKAAVSVYNAGGDLKFTFNSSERFVSNAFATDDGNYLAAVTLGQSSGSFISTVVLYDLLNTEPIATFAAGSGICLDIGEVSGNIAMVCDDALNFCSSVKKETASYSYGGDYLREYDLHGENYAVLLLNRYQSGSVGRLVTVGNDGQEIATLNVSDEILSVSAAGRYIAVLYADRLVIYNPQLEQYASLTGTDYAREALVRTDGSALLLAAERAVRFLP